MKEWILRKEFFGGILYSKRRKTYYSVDNDTYSFLKDIAIVPKKITLTDHVKFLKQERVITKDDQERFSFCGDVIGFTRNQSEFLSSPLRVHFACTYRCPQRCNHCFVAKYKQQKRELTTMEIFSLIDSLVSLGTYEILFSGGEPLVRKDIFKCLAYAVEKGMSVKLFTNGLLLTEDKIVALSKIGLKSLTIGLDGSDPHIYSKIRNSNQYARVVDNIKKAREVINYKIALKYTITRFNSDHQTIKNMVKFAAENGIVLMLRAVKPCGNALENQEMLIGYNEYLDIIRKVYEEYSNLGLNINPALSEEKFYFRFSKRSIKFDDSPLLYLGWGCLGGYIHSFIDPYGNMYPCGYIIDLLPDKKGNILEENPIEIWQHGEQFVYKRGLQGNKECNECKHFVSCRGGCRARAVFMGNGINCADPYCRKKARFTGKEYIFLGGGLKTKDHLKIQ